MTKTKQTWRLAKLPLAVSLASTLAAPAFGVTFNIGEIEGQFDSSMSVGSSWSVRGADPDLIGVNNGGQGLYEHDLIMEYLNAEKVKITQVKTDMNASMEEAKQFLEANKLYHCTIFLMFEV